MAIRPLVILPDPVLRKVSVPIAEITPDIRKLAEDMLETMYDAPGIGLAAIQIGEPVRLVTIDISKKSDEDEVTPKAPMVFANPEVTWRSEEMNVHEEGCLSIPEYYEEVERPARVKVRYLDLDGATQEIEADGILATCLQHEIDHLNGVLFIDYLSRLKRERVNKRFAKQAKRESAA